MPLTESQRALIGTIQARDISHVRKYFEHYPLADFSIEFENTPSSGWRTPLITAVAYGMKDGAPVPGTMEVTQLLIDSGADIYYVNTAGTTALSMAYSVGNQAAIDYFAPLYVKHYGKDVLVVAQAQAAMDACYPPNNPREKTATWKYRDVMTPLLKQYLTQADSLSPEIIAFLREEIRGLNTNLKERRLKASRRDREAAKILDPEEKAKFIAEYNALWDIENEESNRLLHEQAALRAKAESLEKELKLHKQMVGSVQKDVKDLSQRMEVVEEKVEMLWDEHEREEEVKAQKLQIRQDETLRPFYQGVKGHINDFWVGRQAARSKEVVVQGPSTLAKDVLTLAGDAIPIPAVGLVLKAVGHVAHLYQRYKKGQRDHQVDKALSDLASDSVELNEEIVDPAGRMLTRMGTAQLRRFGPSERAKLAERAAQLMLIYILYELPSQPHASYGEVIQQLILAVRVKGLEGVKIKDAQGKTLKPRNLATLSGEVLTESQVFTLFDMKVSPQLPLRAPVSALPSGRGAKVTPSRQEEQKKKTPVGMGGSMGMGSRPLSPPPKQVKVLVVAVATPSRSKSPAPGLPSITPQHQPVKASALRPQVAPVNRSSVLPSRSAQPVQLSSSLTPSLVMVE